MLTSFFTSVLEVTNHRRIVRVLVVGLLYTLLYVEWLSCPICFGYEFTCMCLVISLNGKDDRFIQSYTNQCTFHY